MCSFLEPGEEPEPWQAFRSDRDECHLENHSPHPQKVWDRAAHTVWLTGGRRAQTRRQRALSNKDGDKMKNGAGRKRNETGCHGLLLHKGFSFPTHPFSSVWGLLIALSQSLPPQIKVENLEWLRTRNMFPPHHHSAATSLSCLFICCLFVHTAWRNSQATATCQCACHLEVGWVGAVRVTCNAALIGVTSPGEGVL